MAESVCQIEFHGWTVEETPLKAFLLHRYYSTKYSFLLQLQLHRLLKQMAKNMNNIRRWLPNLILPPIDTAFPHKACFHPKLTKLFTFVFASFSDLLYCTEKYCRISTQKTHLSPQQRIALLLPTSTSSSRFMGN